MSELNQSSVNLLERAIDDKIRKAVRGGQSTHLATVTRISNDGTTWVKVYGGAEETPVRRMTTAAQVGDVINVTFSGLSCMGVGNVSSPSATTGQVTKVANESAKAIAGVMSGLLQVRTLVADKVSTKELDAEMATILTAAIENATIRALNANYARVNAANIDTAAIKDAWIDKLLVQTSLLAKEGTVFKLNAIQADAASITTGTLDVRRLIITREEIDPETGELVDQKYLVEIDPETSQPTYQKLDGNIIEPRTIGADKILANSITADEITVKNLVGAGGWINLHEGTFSYGNQATGEGISWDGSQLNIIGAVHIGSKRKQLSDMLTAEDVTVTQNPTQTGYDVDIAGNTFSLVNGSQGPAGTSVTVSKVEYATSTSESQPSSGWSTTAPSTVAEGSWLWVKTTYSDGTDSVIRAKQGKSGTNGTSVTVSKIEYGTSSSASTSPSNWSTTVPTSITKGKWLWVKTTYSDNSTATTKSYVGTDGEDGKSVAIRSATKADGVTTVVLEETDGTTTTTKTLTIADGQDGGSGQPGANGYVHTAWANSADGATDFSTTVSTGKKYLGVYTDNTEADSTSPGAYSWSLIKGETGATAQWYYGTALTHTSGTATLATSSTAGVVVGAMYLNKDTSLCYKCTAISGTTATWTYAGNLTDGVIDNIDVGGRNLLLGTGTAKTNSAFILNSSNYAIYDFYSLYAPYNQIAEVNGIVTVSFDWSCTSTGGNFRVECGASTPYTWGTVVKATGTRSATSNYVDVSSSNVSGHVSISFKAAQAHVSAADTLKLLRIRVDGTDWSGKTITLSNAKAEKGNVATDWTPAPEDQTTYVDNSVYQSSQPNLSPYFSVAKDDASYWKRLVTNAQFTTYDTQVEREGSGGWAHFAGNVTSGNPFVRFEPVPLALKPSTKYTFLVELKTVSAASTITSMNLQLASGMANSDGIDPFDATTYKVAALNANGEYRVVATTRADLSTVAVLSRSYLQVYGTGAFDLYARLSIYEGDYSGPYKPYVGNLLYGSASDSVEYIVGTQTAKTGSWTGITKDSSLYTGKTIAYKLPYAGNGNASLQLKDSTGNNVGGNIAVYLNTTRVTTQFGAGAVINMTYDGTYWRASSIPNSNNYDRRLHNQYIKAAANLSKYSICAGTASGYKTLAANVKFDLSYPILYLNADNVSGQSYAVASGGQTASMYEAMPSVDPANTLAVGNIPGIAANKMLYVKGTVSGNTFTCASTGFLTCNVSNSDDGLAYIPIGKLGNDYTSSATSKLFFATSKEIYCYKDGAFGPVSIREAIAIRSGANSRAQLVYYRTETKKDSSFTGPTTWVTTTTDVYNAWTTKVPPLSASTDEDAVKYPFLYVAMQRQSMAQNAAGTTCLCSTPQLDDTITTVDGNMLITGSVTANALAASSVTAEKIDATELAVNGELILGDVRATQVADGIVTFTTLQSDLRNQLNSNNETLGNLASAIQVDLDSSDPSITLIPSSSGSGVTAVLSNNALSFNDGGVMVAEIRAKTENSGSQLYITDANVVGTLMFGGYAFIPRSNGNLSLKWIGTEVTE